MTSGPKEHSVVAIYDSRGGAEAGVKAFQHAGLDLNRLSAIGKGFPTEEHALGLGSSTDRMGSRSERGAFWGSLGGLLLLWEPIIVMGPLVGWMAEVLERDAAGGVVSALAGSLASIGIPKDSVAKYGWELKAGKFLVLAHGTAGFVVETRAVLVTSGASLVKVHPNRSSAHGRYLLPAHPKPTAKEKAILDLRSDEEVARVSIAETATRRSG